MKNDIFKAYDIRGIFSQEFNGQDAYNIGRAYLDYIRETEQVDEPQIVIGRDMRTSSNEIFRNFSQGVIKQGGDVFDIGLSTTPMLYWAVNFLTAQGGAIITASHNPAQYNGFKLTRSQAIALSGQEGLEEIKQKVLQENYKTGETKEIIMRKPVLSYYVPFLTKNTEIDIQEKIVIDASNAMTAIVLPRVLEVLKVNYIPLYFKLDGTFPHHEANPFKPENLVDLQKKMKEEKATLGIAFDGDGDRIVFLDEDCNIVRGDFITAFLAQDMLEKTGKGKVIYDLRSLWMPREVIEKAGGEAIMSKVGHAFIKQEMREEKALFAGEMSGHYFFRDFFGCESAILTMIKVLKILSKKKKRLKELIQPYKKYYHSGEINFEAQDKQAKIKNLEKKYVRDNVKIYHIDGLTIEFKDWWFNVRPSNTEPLLRLNLEVKKQEDLKKRIKELKEFIKK